MRLHLLTALLIIPLIGFVGCLLVPRVRERTIVAVAMTLLAAETLVLVGVVVGWLRAGAHPLAAQLGTLYSSSGYTFSLGLYFDVYTAVFLAMSVIILTLISLFSKFYLHRDPGFKRFYVTIFLFLTGLTLITLAGNFELLFVGWELIGISSVLLIAFYRDRYLPARNALKVFSVYRIGDAFLLAAALYAHHVFAQNIQFADVSQLVAAHGSELTLLGLLLLVVAMVKSAQFPFSYWLPRAMEGPTTSSAIFYGALSVHMGLFLLLRTHPLWEGSVWVHVAIGLSGLLTAIVASSIARVQSSTKTQIAYSSIAQIGIMFVEVALGLYWLALIHFVSNAALRAYQLLISPSMVGYLTHDQFFYFTPPVHKIGNTLLGKVRGTLYVLGIKEWNMNTIVRDYVWGPLKTLGRQLSWVDGASVRSLSAAVLVLMVVVLTIPAVVQAIAVGAGVIAVLLYVRAYSAKTSARTTWRVVLLGHVYSTLSLVIAADGWHYVPLYAAGIVLAYVGGLWCLGHITAGGESDKLERYHGAVYRYPRVGNVFFVLCLMFMAFPVTPSFLAQDAWLSSIHTYPALYTLLFCVGYLVMGVAVLRLYMKVFFGPHESSRHEKAYRSS